MGNALGCCGSNGPEAGELKSGTIFNRDLQSPDKIRLIIKIQAAFRGYMDRRRVGSLRITAGHKSMMHSNHAY